MSRVIAWFSCGAASAVAAKLTIQKYGSDAVVAYCDTMSDEHPDNARFFNEVQDWLGVDILKLKNKKYKDVDDVIEKRRYIAGVAGAPCTNELKKKVRQEFERPDDTHVFGYTCEPREVRRAKRMAVNMPELITEFPLIDNHITKQDTVAIIAEAGIDIPVMYKLGYANNNCIGCVKAGSFGYWNKIRVDFPEVFAKRAAQERKFNAAINHRMVDGERVRVFLDELDPSWGRDEPLPDFSCGITCQLLSRDFDEEAA